MNEFFNLEIGLIKLNELALRLGSDVPFFIKSKPAIGYSRGEILKELDTYINSPILIVNPGIHISTKEAFGYITPNESKFNYKYFEETKILDFNYLLKVLQNDFEKFVFKNYPGIMSIKQEMINSGALFSLMSGTGSTVYGVFENIEAAKLVSNKFPEEYFKFIS